MLGRVGLTETPKEISPVGGGFEGDCAPGTEPVTTMIQVPVSRGCGINLFFHRVSIAIMKPPDEEAMAMARMMSPVDSQSKEPIKGRCRSRSV